MNKKGAERLAKLAHHLEHGKLGHKVFDFTLFNDSGENICGTAGCAIGELPILFPKTWEFGVLGDPQRIKNPFGIWTNVSVFF